VIAFATSLLVGILGNVAVVAYGKRRKPGATLTWGEAMVATTAVFALMLIWYGIIPHQWITMCDAQWNWRADRFLFGPFDLFKPHRFLPFTITYQTLRDLVVVVIYGAALTLHVAQWTHWQNRAKTKAVVVPTTAYGRPLVRKG
jgi:hypothetical protein